MLLERGEVNPEQAHTGYGRTPLSWAAGSGHEGIVKILLEKEDVDTDLADTEYGRTPHSWAVKEVFVKCFLFRDNAECFFSFISLRDRQSDEETWERKRVVIVGWLRRAF